MARGKLDKTRAERLIEKLRRWRSGCISTMPEGDSFEYSHLLEDDGRYELDGRVYWATYLPTLDTWSLHWQQGDGTADFIVGADGKLWRYDRQLIALPTLWTVDSLTLLPEPEEPDMIPF